MGLFNKIIDVFFEEDPSGKTSQKGQIQQPAPAQQASSGTVSSSSASGTVTSPTPSSDTNSNVYQNFIQILQRSVESNNLPGFDFFEFNQLYKRFLSEGKSDSEAIKTALTSAETMRVDKNTLIANYQHYTKCLVDQKNIFQNDLDNFLKNNINEPKKESVSIDTEISEKLALIKQCEQDIETLKQKKNDIGINVDKAGKQVEGVKAAFEKAYTQISSELNSLHDKLKQL